MSLFEKLNNKRYDLQEKPSDDVVNPEFKDRKNKFNQADKINKKELKKAKKQFKKDLDASGEKPSSSIKSDLNAKSGTKSKGNKPVKINVRDFEPPVKKSVDARVITKKYNERNPNRPEYVKPKEYKAAHTKTQIANPGQQRPLGQLVKKTKPSTTAKSGKLTPGQIDFSKAGELAAKRKARIDTSTGKATQKGVFDFAKNRGGFNRMSQGMSKSDFKKMISSDPKKASQFKSVVTKAKNIASNPASKEYKKIADTINKSDYAGKFAKKDPKIAKMNASQKAANLARVKAQIDAKDALKGRYKKPKTVLKRTEPGSKFRASKIKGFDVVPTSNPVGKEILKKMDNTGFVPPKPEKLNTFQRLKKKLTTGWKIPKKDWDLKTIRGPKGNAISQTRRSFKPLGKGFLGISGPVKKGLAMLPNRYKAIGLALVAAPTIKKTFFAPKAEPKVYGKYQKPLGFDTGKQNISRKLYKKNLEKRDPEQYKKEFPKKLPQSMNPYNKPTPKATQYGSTFTYKDKKTGEMKTGSKLTTKKPKNINKNLP